MIYPIPLEILHHSAAQVHGDERQDSWFLLWPEPSYLDLAEGVYYGGMSSVLYLKPAALRRFGAPSKGWPKGLRKATDSSSKD